MSYYIAQTKPLTRWRRIFRWAYFPYVVYKGTPERYPHVRVVRCADTLCGARRAIRRDKAAMAAPPYLRVVERS